LASEETIGVAPSPTETRGRGAQITSDQHCLKAGERVGEPRAKKDDLYVSGKREKSEERVKERTG